MRNFFKAFNCPGRFFETLGYIMVVIGIITLIVGVFIVFKNFYFGVYLLVYGVITAIVAPQVFFAISKVVKAAEKYLQE